MPENLLNLVDTTIKAWLHDFNLMFRVLFNRTQDCCCSNCKTGFECGVFTANLVYYTEFWYHSVKLSGLNSMKHKNIIFNSGPISNTTNNHQLLVNWNINISTSSAKNTATSKKFPGCMEKSWQTRCAKYSTSALVLFFTRRRQCR